MKHKYYWDLQNEIFSLVLKNEFSNKTLCNKIKRAFEDNTDLFKNDNQVSLSSYENERLERRARCYAFIKTGFFSREKYDGLYKISEIFIINSYVGEKYECKFKDGFTLEITKQDYEDLKLVLSNQL